MPRRGNGAVHDAVRATSSGAKPQLLFFQAQSSGRCRRVDGFLAQVLQRRANHDTFRVYRVDVDTEQALVGRFGVDIVPTLIVVDDKRIRGRLEAPRGCREIETLLAPWLR
jgi:thioredoxin-like negative regulator of GroEL